MFGPDNLDYEPSEKLCSSELGIAAALGKCWVTMKELLLNAGNKTTYSCLT